MNPDQIILEALNTWVSRSPASFDAALAVEGRLPWVIAALLVAAFWFSGEPGAIPTEVGRRTRLRSRRVLVVSLLGMLVSLVVVFALQSIVERPRPMTTLSSLTVPIEPARWTALRETYAPTFSFPAPAMAVFASLLTAIAFLSPVVALLATGLYLYFGLLYVGTGLFWPVDLIAGALIGFIITALLVKVEPRIQRRSTAFALLFEQQPIIMYTIGLLILFDLSQRFAVLRSILIAVFSDAVFRL